VKLLNGSELALFIKERQAREVTQLRRVNNITPKLAIVMCVEDPVINTYVRLKKKYGADLRVEVDVHEVKQIQIPDLIEKLNKDKSIHGIIVQLPLENIEETDEIVNLVAPGKDVDALGARSKFEPATPMAILWLLAG
jgi:methylenetetrahydrofolate dehydrogenase (NADP+)/methenyltetrahydrofolate cyclohydrolase